MDQVSKSPESWVYVMSAEFIFVHEKSNMATYTWSIDQLCIFLLSTIGFLVPQNVYFATGIIILGNLVVTISSN